MKKFIAIIFLAGLVFTSCENETRKSSTSFPTHGIGRDKYVTDVAGVLTPAEVNSLKDDLSQYEKDSSVEVAVLIIDSMSKYGYEKDIFSFATDLFNNWGIGKAVASNGVLYVIAIKDRQSRIQTGRGIGEGLPDIKTKRILNQVHEKMKAAEYYAAIVEVVAGIKGAVVKTPATDKKAIDKKTEEKKEQKNKDDLNNLGDWAILFVIAAGILAFIVWVVSLFKRKKQKKLADIAAKKKEYTDFNSLKNDINSHILNCKQLINGCRGANNFEHPSITTAQEVIDAIEGSKAMVIISEEQFYAIVDKGALVGRRMKALELIKQAKIVLMKLVQDLAHANTEKRDAERCAIEMGGIIDAIKDRIGVYNKALLLLDKYPKVAVNSKLNVSAANAEIEKAKSEFGKFQSKANDLVAEVRNIPFAIGAYDDLLGRIEKLQSSAKQAFSMNAVAAVVAKSIELREAIDGMKKNSDEYVETLKQAAQKASNRSDVTDASKGKVRIAMAYAPKHTDDIITDWVYLQMVMSTIRSATSACNSDVEQAERKRRQKREAEEREQERQRELERQQERDRLAAIVVANQRNDDLWKSNNDDNNRSNNDNNNFGGGDTGGGGAQDQW